MMRRRLLFIAALSSASSLTLGWTSTGIFPSRSIETASKRREGHVLLLGSGSETSGDFPSNNLEGEPSPLFLSESDRRRLKQLHSRTTTMPIIILDAMLPGQCLQFESADPKFQKLIDYVLVGDNEESPSTGEISMLGFNPHTGKPLNRGVSVRIDEENVEKKGDGSYVIRIKGERRLEVQGEPWMDDSKSFYMANVEFLDESALSSQLDDDEEEFSSVEEQVQAQSLYQQVPVLVEEWLQWVLKTGKSDVEGMKQRMTDIGAMPKEDSETAHNISPKTVGNRAIWVAALINPLPALGVSLEVRPAMLACNTDIERIRLAVAAIQSSIDHMSGKKRLF